MCGLESFQQNGTGIAGRIGVDVLNYLDGNAAGFLSAFVAAHAVGEESEPPFLPKLLVARWLPIRVAVFVVLAFATDVAERGQINSRANSHERFWIIQKQVHRDVRCLLFVA